VIIEIRGETLELLAGHAVYWPAQQMLLVADVHCGKAATFRARHVPVPEGDMDDDLDRLTRLIDATGAREVAILGDWIHAAAGCTPSVVRSIVEWRERHRAVRIHWVRGNHDRAPEALRAQFGFEECEFLERGPFRLEHVPRKHAGAFVIGGHIHPKVVIGGRGFPRSHVPCFHFTRHFAVLPAFGSFTGGYPVKREAGSRVFLIADDTVVEWAG
jgi:DNA ligase-associated metallophosphoesterase